MSDQVEQLADDEAAPAEQKRPPDISQLVRTDIFARPSEIADPEALIAAQCWDSRLWHR